MEAELILFPGESQSGYGVFIGGRDLDSPTPQYLAFLIRRDGQVAVELRRAGTSRHVMPWRADSAVTPYPGRGTGRNTLRIGVESDSLIFSANGQRLYVVPRAELPAEGHFGFRIGSDVNLHITSLDLTQRLAPPRS